jgi:hypothetical protein
MSRYIRFTKLKYLIFPNRGSIFLLKIIGTAVRRDIDSFNSGCLYKLWNYFCLKNLCTRRMRARSSKKRRHNDSMLDAIFFLKSCGMGAGTTCERGELEKNIKTRCNKLYTWLPAIESVSSYLEQINDYVWELDLRRKEKYHAINPVDD